MTLIVFATCNAQPAIQKDDALCLGAIEAGGARVEAAPWNGPFAPFERADLVVIRSTWDYWDDADAFARCLDRLKSLKRVANDPDLMIWNMNKRYLLDLAERGAPLPPTRLVAPEAAALADALDALGLDEAIVKPTVSAQAIGLSVIRRNDAQSLDRAARALGGEGLVQPLIREVQTAGETSLLYFNGEFSHAVVKRPAEGDIRVQVEHGGRTQPADAPASAIAEGRRVLSLLPTPAAPLYARVDLVVTPGASHLMEVELIEPSLYLTHAPERAARDFAGSVLQAATTRLQAPARAR